MREVGQTPWSQPLRLSSFAHSSHVTKRHSLCPRPQSSRSVYVPILGWEHFFGFNGVICAFGIELGLNYTLNLLTHLAWIEVQSLRFTELRSCGV